MASVAVFYILTGGSVDTTSSVAMGAAGRDLPSVFGSHCSDDMFGAPPPAACDIKVVCLVAPLPKVGEDVSIRA